MKEIVNGIVTFIATGVWLVVSFNIVVATIKKVNYKLEDINLETEDVFKIIGIASVIDLGLILIARLIIFAMFRIIMF